MSGKGVMIRPLTYDNRSNLGLTCDRRQCGRIPGRLGADRTGQAIGNLSTLILRFRHCSQATAVCWRFGGGVKAGGGLSSPGRTGAGRIGRGRAIRTHWQRVMRRLNKWCSFRWYKGCGHGPKLDRKLDRIGMRSIGALSLLVRSLLVGLYLDLNKAILERKRRPAPAEQRLIPLLPAYQGPRRNSEARDRQESWRSAIMWVANCGHNIRPVERHRRSEGLSRHYCHGIVHAMSRCSVSLRRVVRRNQQPSCVRTTTPPPTRTGH